MLRAYLQIERTLPEHFKSLAETFEDLPFEPDVLAMYLFTKLVINIGVQTEGHVDPTDDGVCLVIPFGQWEGAELCLSSPGVVLFLQPGDGVIFPSDHYRATTSLSGRAPVQKIPILKCAAKSSGCFLSLPNVSKPLPTSSYG